MDFERLYQFRFRDVDQTSRQTVWEAVAADLHIRLGRPQVVLDPACGLGEFIRSVPARERWAIDQVAFDPALADQGVKTIVGNLLDIELPSRYFDGVLLSNFLEHLASYEEVHHCLKKMHGAIRPGGTIAVLGPNFRFCSKEYFDCADHVLALTDVSVQEHLFSAGFEIASSLPRYLPYSFRSRLPASRKLTALYLRNPWAFRFIGKQFLVMGKV